MIEGDRLIGAVMYGDTDDGGWFYGLIRDGADVTPLRDQLIFGPDYQEPLAEVSAGRCSLAG